MINLTSAKIILDSVGRDAPRLTTFELVYPRFIHAELMTHRVFSRNASSSRAIPVARMRQQLMDSAAMPAEWRMNEPGMQGYTVASPEVVAEAIRLSLLGRNFMVGIADQMEALGLHKQHVNRQTETWQYIKVVVTSAQFGNWFALRNHPAADPTIQVLAKMMLEVYEASTPTLLEDGQWHLPYITDEDDYRAVLASRELGMETDEVLRRMSAARCARVSYNNFKGEVPKIESDLALYGKLVETQPVHASPTEHQASPDLFIGKNFGWRFPKLHGNLNGWLQFRKFIPNENLERLAA